LFSECYDVHHGVSEAAKERQDKGQLTPENCVISCFGSWSCVRVDMIHTHDTPPVTTCYTSGEGETESVSGDVDYYEIDFTCRGESSLSCTCTFSVQYILLS